MPDDFDREPAQPLVLFDGICNLCDRSVEFIIRHDARCEFLFSPLQSDYGEHLVRRLAIDPRRFDVTRLSTFIVVIDDAIYYESDAWVEIFKRLDTPARWLAVVRFVPRQIRDAVYRFVGRHRYRWFGQMPACKVPTPDIARRFRSNLDQDRDA